MNKNKGITLVALVVTIIILLILVGISIATLTGSGLFENARLAKNKAYEAQEKEDGILADYENKIGKYVNASRDYETEIEKLKEEINNLKSIIYAEKYVWESSTYTAGVLNKEYTVEEDGLYYVQNFITTGETKASAQTILNLNDKRIAGNYDKGEEAWATTSATAIVNAKKGDKLSGYFYCNANITSGGDFFFKVIKIK